jgi:hypothetical protein
MGKTSSSAWMCHTQESGLDIAGQMHASSIAGLNSDAFFPVGTIQSAHLCSPSHDYQRSHSKTSSSYDSGQCGHVKGCLRQCCMAHCYLPWNGWSPLWTPIVTTKCPWFDHLIAFTIWWWHILKTECQSAYVALYSQLVLQHGITLGTACIQIFNLTCINTWHYNAE